MPDPYAVLGLPRDATDAAVRGRYLELTRAFPPEQFPEKSAAVRAAYDRVRTADGRAQFWLFGFTADEEPDQLIEEVRCSAPRPRPTLSDLLAKRRKGAP